MRRALAAAALLAACASETPEDEDPPGTTFIALDRDFQGFRAWPRTPVGSALLEGHGEGPRFVYANRPVPAAGETYPMGTILVKAVELDADPTRWEVFAMVKRGGTFNARGAAGWEFFRLRFTNATSVLITGRGLAPTDNGVNLYSTRVEGCNACHGATARGTDHVLSAPLAPGAR